MNYAHSWQSYRTIATQTASPGQLIVMLYDGAIRFCEKALAGFAYDDPCEFNETINNNLIRAQNIINELDSSLDLDRGGDLAVTLRSLYNYMDRRLTESNLKKEPSGIQDTIRRLTILRDAWRQMLSNLASESNAASPNDPRYASLSACV